MSDSDKDSYSAEEARELLRGQQSEEDIHRACVQWIQAQSSAHSALEGLFHPRGGAYKSKAQAGRMKAMGGKKGVPDFCLPVVRTVIDSDGKERSAGGLWIELKSKTGRLRDSQKWWRDFLRAHGHAWTLCRSLDGFQEAVMSYLGGEFELSPSD